MKNYSLRALCSLMLLCLCAWFCGTATAKNGAPYNKSNSENAINGDSLQLVHFVAETKKEMNAVREVYDSRNLSIRAALWHNELALQNTKETTAAEQVVLLQKKIRLQESLQKNEMFLETNTLKVRYRKGVDLIKLLYEKILALDHHFTGMQTYQNVIMLSNPHTYPEFAKAQSVLEQKMKKKNAVTLPGILQSNPFLSATFSVVGTLIGDGTSSEKQEELDNISCILDFTVRMNSDLSVIQHETEYLKTANKNLKEECEKLFADYTKVIDYFVPLENCRQQDDWESLRERLDVFAGQLGAENGNNGGQQGNGSNYGNTYDNNQSSSYGNSNSGGYNSAYGSNSNSGYGSSSNSGYGNNSNSNSGYGSSSNSGYGTSSGGYGSSNSGYGSGQSGNSNNSGGYSSGYDSQQNGYGNGNNQQNTRNSGPAPMSSREAERKRVDLEFATQRVAEFITKYNNFVTQGTQYYQKFDNIVSTYANESACETKLPRQFGELKYDIKSTIEKFTNTYNLPEIQGSRLKDLLYGSVDR